MVCVFLGSASEQHEGWKIGFIAVVGPIVWKVAISYSRSCLQLTAVF